MVEVDGMALIWEEHFPITKQVVFTVFTPHS